MYIIYINTYIYMCTISVQCFSKNISTQNSTIHYYCFGVFHHFRVKCEQAIILLIHNSSYNDRV